MAHLLLLCKWGAAALPCRKSMLRATARLLSVALGVTADRTRVFTGIYGRSRAHRKKHTIHFRLHDNERRHWQTSSIFCNSTMISPAKWAENANGRSTKAMWYGLTWSLMLFLATTPIWSSVVVRVGRIRMLPWIQSQCPRSPEPPSHTSICAQTAVQAWEPSPASEGTWGGSTIGQMCEVSWTPQEHHCTLSLLFYFFACLKLEACWLNWLPFLSKQKCNKLTNIMNMPGDCQLLPAPNTFLWKIVTILISARSQTFHEDCFS